MSKLKFLKASFYYDAFLQGFYANRPGLKTESYNSQYEALMNSCFGWSDFWKKHLEATGHFDAFEVVVNAEPLQKKWAAEYGITLNNERWAKDILEAQIRYFEPTVLFAHDYGVLDAEFRLSLRKKYPFIKKIIGWDGLAWNDTALFAGCDLMLSCLDFVTDYYKKNKIDSYFFSFGFETSILQKVKANPPRFDTSFVGGISLFQGGHHQRLKLLAELSGKINLDLFLSGHELTDWQPYKWPQRQRLLKGNFGDWYRIWKVGSRNKGVVFGTEMYQVLADSKITLNSHIDKAENKSANIRLFEATGTGSCLVTDWKENIADYFEPDREVVTFRSVAECVEKINYLLTHETERLRIASAGHNKTINHFSFQKNITSFLPYLLNSL